MFPPSFKLKPSQDVKMRAGFEEWWSSLGYWHHFGVESSASVRVFHNLWNDFLAFLLTGMCVRFLLDTNWGETYWSRREDGWNKNISLPFLWSSAHELCMNYVKWQEFLNAAPPNTDTGKKDRNGLKYVGASCMVWVWLEGISPCSLSHAFPSHCSYYLP